MKAALFCTSRYMGKAPEGVWPLPGEYCSPDIAMRSMATTLEQFKLADAFGFDWVTVAEHHYSSFSMTPNPMVLAGALSQIVRRAKIAVLGPTLPIFCRSGRFTDTGALVSVSPYPSRTATPTPRPKPLISSSTTWWLPAATSGRPI